MSTVSVAQNYGAILLGGLLAFRYVVSLYHRFTTYLLAACPDVLTCSSSHTGDYTLASPIVLSHWCGNYPSVFCTFWSDATGHCNVVCSCPRVCEVNINIFFRFLDLCHSAFVATALWDSIIKPYGDFNMIDRIPWCVSFHHLLWTGSWYTIRSVGVSKLHLCRALTCP